jgi:glycosyltransferase involved in cell wall biosynthesis
MARRVTLIIPAFNEAECIGQVLAEVPPGVVEEVIVVDNGSMDGTSEIALSAGVTVVHEPRLGYGYACAAGAATAKCDLLAFMDGDGSFDPVELTRLLTPLERNEAELSLGSRMLAKLPPGAMPPHQIFGNRIISWLLSKFYNASLTDLGPFRALSRELLFSLDMQERTYGWPVEMMVKVARKRLRIIEVPVSYRTRLGGQSKVGGSLRGSFKATYHILRVFYHYGF